MKNMSIRGQHHTALQLHCLFTGTAKQNQAAGLKGVSPGLPGWETIELNKSYKSLLYASQALFKSPEPKWAAGQKVCGAFSQCVTMQSLINKFLTTGRKKMQEFTALMCKGQEVCG